MHFSPRISKQTPVHSHSLYISLGSGSVYNIQRAWCLYISERSVEMRITVAEWARPATAQLSCIWDSYSCCWDEIKLRPSLSPKYDVNFAYSRDVHLRENKARQLWLRAERLASLYTLQLCLKYKIRKWSHIISCIIQINVVNAHLHIFRIWITNYKVRASAARTPWDRKRVRARFAGNSQENRPCALLPQIYWDFSCGTKPDLHYESTLEVAQICIKGATQSERENRRALWERKKRRESLRPAKRDC